jgi:biotin-(acetyl-CoA carboxylase) ligase
VVHAPSGDFAGRAERADVDGALLIRLDSGATVRVVAGDVRLRLAAKV